jgi:predicted DNA-binding transcriptional regulator AlpA
METTAYPTIDRIIRLAELSAMLGVCNETIRLWRKSKIKGVENFPQPIQLGARAIGWRLSDINAFIASRMSKQYEMAN